MLRVVKNTEEESRRRRAVEKMRDLMHERNSFDPHNREVVDAFAAEAVEEILRQFERLNVLTSNVKLEPSFARNIVSTGYVAHLRAHLEPGAGLFDRREVEEVLDILIPDE